MKTNEVLRAYAAFKEADDYWSALLPKIVNARYLPIGRGKPGSALRAAHDAREVARIKWVEAIDRHRMRKES
jgi:hypothetical protein